MRQQLGAPASRVGDATVKTYVDNALGTVNQALFGQTTPGTTLQTSVIPSLDASHIVSGLFGIGQIPGLPTSKITSGTFSQTMIDNLATDLSNLLGASTFQTLLDSLANAMGHTGTGHTVSDIESYFGLFPAGNVNGTLGTGNIPNLPATQITSGVLGTSFIPNITKAMSTDMQSIVTTIFGNSAIGNELTTEVIPNITAAMSSDLQGIVDNINHAITGSNTTGNTVATVLNNLQSLLHNLFGQASLGTELQTTVIPNITKAMSTDLQGLVTTIFGTSSIGTELTTEVIPNITQAMSTDLSALVGALFGGSSIGTTVQATAIPTISQAQVASLEADLGSLLPNATWQTFINGTVGGTTKGVNDLITYVNNIDSAAASAVTTGNYNGLLTALFGSPSVGATVQSTAIPTISQSQVASLEADLDALLPGSTWQNFVNGLVGGTAGGVNDVVTYINNIDSAAANAVTTGNYNGLLTALFGGTTVGSTISTSAVPNLNASKITSGQLTSTFISGLFGGASLSTDLQNLSNVLFGSPSTIGSTVVQSAVPTGIPATKVSNLFGGSSLSADLQNLLNSLFGSTTTIGSTITTGAVPTGIPATKIANVLGGANLGADLTSVHTTATGAATTASSASTASGAAQTTANTVTTNLGTTWQALFGSSSTPTTTTKVNAASITAALGQGSLGADLTALGNLLFGSATVGTHVAPTSIANLFGGSTLGQDLTNLATALFGGTSVTSTSQVHPGSVASVMSNANLGADVSSTQNLVVTNQGTLATVQSQVNALTTNSSSAAGHKYVEAAQGGSTASWGSQWTTSVTNGNVAPDSQLDVFAMTTASSSSVDLKLSGILNSGTALTTDQIVSVVFFDSAQAMSGGAGPVNTLKGRMNSTGTDYIYAKVGYSTITLGYCLSGTEQSPWATVNYSVPAGALVELYCGTSAGHRVYQVNVNGTTILGPYTEVGTSSAMDTTTHIQAGMDMLASHGVFNDVWPPARVKQFTFKDSNVTTTTYGSSARYYRTAAASAVACPRGSVTPLTTNAFNITEYQSSDIQLVPGGMCFYTPGRYHISCVVRFTSPIAYSASMDLVRYTSGGAALYQSSVNYNTASMYGLEGHFDINAVGDGQNTEAWYCGIDLSGSGTGPNLTSDANGLDCWISVTRVA